MQIRTLNQPSSRQGLLTPGCCRQPVREVNVLVRVPTRPGTLCPSPDAVGMRCAEMLAPALPDRRGVGLAPRLPLPSRSRHLLRSGRPEPSGPLSHPRRTWAHAAPGGRRHGVLGSAGHAGCEWPLRPAAPLYGARPAPPGPFTCCREPDTAAESQPLGRAVRPAVGADGAGAPPGRIRFLPFLKCAAERRDGRGPGANIASSPRSFLSTPSPPA